MAVREQASHSRHLASSFTWVLIVNIVAALVVVPIGSAGQTANPQLDRVTIAQGVAPAPAEVIGWRVIEGIASPLGQAVYEDRATGFTISPSDSILVVDEATAAQTLLDAEEALFHSDGSRQIVASITDEPLPYYRIELVPEDEIGEAGDETLIQGVQRFNARDLPDGFAGFDIALRSGFLAEGETAPLLAGTNDVQLLVLSGSLDTGTTKRDAGQASLIFAGGEVELTANEDTRYLVAVLGDAVPDGLPAIATPVAATPVASADPDARTVTVASYACPADMAWWLLETDACEPLADGLDIGLLGIGGDIARLDPETAEIDGHIATWSIPSSAAVAFSVGPRTGLPDGYGYYDSRRSDGTRTDRLLSPASNEPLALDLYYFPYGVRDGTAGEIYATGIECPAPSSERPACTELSLFAFDSPSIILDADGNRVPRPLAPIDGEQRPAIGVTALMPGTYTIDLTDVAIPDGLTLARIDGGPVVSEPDGTYTIEIAGGDDYGLELILVPEESLEPSTSPSVAPSGSPSGTPSPEPSASESATPTAIISVDFYTCPEGSAPTTVDWSTCAPAPGLDWDVTLRAPEEGIEYTQDEATDFGSALLWSVPYAETFALVASSPTGYDLQAAWGESGPISDVPLYGYPVPLDADNPRAQVSLYFFPEGIAGASLQLVPHGCASQDQAEATCDTNSTMSACGFEVSFVLFDESGTEIPDLRADINRVWGPLPPGTYVVNQDSVTNICEVGTVSNATLNDDGTFTVVVGPDDELIEIDIYYVPAA